MGALKSTYSTDVEEAIELAIAKRAKAVARGFRALAKLIVNACEFNIS